MKRAACVFALLTVVMTWPIARHPASLASAHQDVYFNMWRLGWFAHALSTKPAQLFNGNIFYPEAGTLALSDAMPVEGLIAAPLLWAGVPPVLVHTIMMLLPIAASGLAMFALARYLTGSRGAGLLAGIVFAFAPYRFEHIMHMELQWTVWMPLALLALHRALDTGRWKYGLATGACMALQMLSCIYYGIFLATIVAVAAPLLLVADRGVSWRKAIPPLAAGAVLALAICAVYAIPFLRQHDRVGERGVGEINTFSAVPSNYLNVPEGNWLYGNPGRPGRGERRLFPGATPVLLAIAGLLVRTPTRRQIVYLLLLALAFEISIGYSGYLYPWLHDTLAVFRGLRALARLGIFVVMALGALAAFGYAALVEGRSVMVRRVVCAALAGVMLAEYATSVTLMEFPNVPPPVYRVLAHQPRGVVAELPAADPNQLPGNDPERIYMSTFYWFPTVNGYSGHYPASYLLRMERLGDFPDERSLRALEFDGVRYVVVHEAPYSPAQLAAIRSALVDGRHMAELGRFADGGGFALLYDRGRVH